MKKRFSLLFRRSWSFKVYILTLFLMLILISFCSVGAFGFSKQYSSDLTFSKGIAKRTVATINEKLEAMVHSSVQTVQVSACYFQALGDLSIENRKLTSFLLNVVKNNHNFANIFVGLDNGNFIGSYNRSFVNSKTFSSDPLKFLPSKTAYSLTYIDMSSSPPTETRSYMDEHFNELAKEFFSIASFNVKNRPWYVGPMKTNDIFWTGLYPFIFMEELGVSISYPIVNADGKITGVVGIDLPLIFLSQFIEQQRIGKTGKVFIVDNRGKILAPMSLLGNEKNQGELASIIPDIFKQYMKKNQDESLVIIPRNQRKHLTFITKLPPAFNENWRIIIVVPLNDFLGETFLMQKELLLIVVCILIITSFIVVKYAQKISFPIAILSEELDKIGSLDLKSNLRIKSHIKEILLIKNAVAALRRAVYSFAKYIPKEIVLDLFQKKEEILLGGEKRNLTIFFSDITGFSDIAESLSIDLLSELLSEYFDKMSKIILRSNGTIDKFLGDGIMAFWGAPLPISDHAAKACTATLHCKAMIVQLNQKHKEKGLPEFATRFGINSGMAIVGNIGTQERMSYTAIGDAVNITSRLQAIDKVYHTSILISEHVYEQLDDQFIVRPLDVILVKGKAQTIKIYELIGKLGEEKEIAPTEDEILLCTLFCEAFAAMEGNDLRKAHDLLASIAKKFPKDYPTQLLLKKVEGQLD